MVVRTHNYVLQVKNAFFSYGDNEVLSDLSFCVEKGSIYCIVGPNGCGKTTLLDCILGLAMLNRGDIFVDETRINAFKPKQLAEKLAYIPQQHQRSFPYTVKEAVIMGRAHKTNIFSSPSKDDELIAKQAMDRVGILQLAEKPYTQISGGQCQLVMIARALAQQAEILVMDEPTSHLDFKNELILLEIILDLIKNNNISVIMATHFPNHAFYFEANNVPVTLALMNNGIFEKTGNPAEILNEENVRRIYNINAKVINYSMDNKTQIKQIVPLSTLKDNSLTL